MNIKERLRMRLLRLATDNSELLGFIGLAIIMIPLTIIALIVFLVWKVISFLF